MRTEKELRAALKTLKLSKPVVEQLVLIRRELEGAYRDEISRLKRLVAKK